jgi:hypothetical protein
VPVTQIKQILTDISTIATATAPTVVLADSVAATEELTVNDTASTAVADVSEHSTDAVVAPQLAAITQEATAASAAATAAAVACASNSEQERVPVTQTATAVTTTTTASASVAVVVESGAATAAANHEAAEVVLQQPQASQQLLCAVNTEQIDTDGALAQPTADLHCNGYATAIATADKHFATAASTEGRGMISSQSSSNMTDSEDKTKHAIASRQQQQQQQQRLLAAESRVKAAAQTVAATAAAATAALCHVMAQQILSDTHAVLAATSAAVSAVDSASVALKEQLAALQELHAVQLDIQQQCLSTHSEHGVAVDCVGTAESDESGSDDDCPPLAYASEMQSTTGELSDNTALSAPVATVTATISSTSSSRVVSKTDRGTVQKQSPQQQQPCVQCGKLTKKRCRRCQAVYYCSEQCQMLCFKDSEHRAQCDAAAAVLALQVA